jgi:glucokinase
MIKRALCGDIGGTNANLCIAEYGEQITITEKARLQTKEYRSFSDLINDYLKLRSISLPEAACFAVAGVVHQQRVEMTHADLVVDANEIIQATGLKRVHVINDFDAVGYAINILDLSEILVLNEGIPSEEGVKGAIGAGTGLGKSILLFDKGLDVYRPYPSEGGHADFASANSNELLFLEGLEQPSWEHLVSGRGVLRIYHALQKSRYPQEPANLTAHEISESRHQNPLCRETFHWFVKFYARAARNFAIEILAKGGVYLAGGISAANWDIFGETFMDEFIRHSNPIYREFLQRIPVKLIKNYDISLKGAAFALNAVP